jgi:hypothetical protein
MKEKEPVIKKRSLLISATLASKFDELKARIILVKGKRVLTETLLEKWINQELEEIKKENKV